MDQRRTLEPVATVLAWFGGDGAGAGCPRLLPGDDVLALLGFINAVFARNFDDISIIPTFVLTPLTYLGGVFYSISLLPPFWQTVSLANPVLHMVNAFRYGILGVSDIKISVAITFMLIATVVLYIGCARLLVSGRGMRT